MEIAYNSLVFITRRSAVQVCSSLQKPHQGTPVTDRGFYFSTTLDAGFTGGDLNVHF